MVYVYQGKATKHLFLRHCWQLSEDQFIDERCNDGASVGAHPEHPLAMPVVACQGRPKGPCRIDAAQQDVAQFPTEDWSRLRLKGHGTRSAMGLGDSASEGEHAWPKGATWIFRFHLHSMAAVSSGKVTDVWSLCRSIYTVCVCESWGSPAAVNGHSHEVADKHSHADSQWSQDLHHQQNSSSGLVPMP